MDLTETSLASMLCIECIPWNKVAKVNDFNTSWFLCLEVPNISVRNVTDKRTNAVGSVSQRQMM